jgi:hypothetical protein
LTVKQPATVTEGLRVVSLTPGRVRLKAPSLKRSDTLAARLQQRLDPLPGVKQVEINATTGSVLIKYDQQLFAREAAVAALQHALAGELTRRELTDLLEAMLHALVSQTEARHRSP